MTRRTSASKSRRKRRRPRTTRRGRQPEWAHLPEEELLDVRLCDLGLRIEGTVLEKYLDRLYQELEHRHLRFRPHFWLSEEWFTPDGVPGVAIAFCLAHPRLRRLERRHMLELEGGTEEWFMRIARHETGHAIDNAYQLRRRLRRRRIFGKPSRRYPESYRPKPGSQSFVLHLESWYAQSHPDEDFAETFAVWLQPRSNWRKRYQHWPAIKKLQYMDELMGEIAGQRPVVTRRTRVEPLSQIHKTLREHYREKRAQYASDYPDFYDRDLRRLFVDAGGRRKRESAAVFIDRMRPVIRSDVSRWTGEHPYTIDQVLQDMIWRCRELSLEVAGPERELRLGLAIMVTVQTMDFLHSGGHRIAL